MAKMRILKNLIKLKVLVASVIITSSSSSYGHKDLVDVYKIAERNDVIVKQQLELYNATKKDWFIEGGDLLPQINLRARRSFNKITHVGTDRRFYSKGYDLELEQILFDWAQWQEFLRTSPVITVAEKNWYLANQDLILRVSESYINILNAEDTLEFTEKEYEAINELYQESRERFNVGVITKADIDQVRSDLDSVTADLYAARAAVLNNKDILAEIINTNVPELAKVKENAVLPKPNPKSVKKWLEAARKYNLTLQAAHANRLISGHNIKIAEANFMPTVYLNARLRGSDNRQILQNLTGASREFVNSFRIGIELTSPNLNPYGPIARHKQAKANYHRTDKEYIEEYRRTEKLIKQYYRDTVNNQKKIQALKQAVKASQSALDANRENFEVGTRTYVIVLERISDLYSAKRDYKDALYDYILSLLRLEDAAGRLSIKDLISVNKMLYKHKKILNHSKKTKV